MSELLLLERQEGGVGVLTINRGHMRNVLGEPGDGAVFAAMREEINADNGLRCVVLTGAGSAFSAGGNVKAMQEALEGGKGVFGGKPLAVAEGYRTDIHRIVRSLWGIEAPMVAAINGPALGLGNDVACLCDVRIASRTAVMGSTFGALGLIPGDGGAWLLPRIVGLPRAYEMIFTAKRLDAETALAWGLVSAVSEPENVLEDALALARTIASNSGPALRFGKRLVRQGMETSFTTAMDSAAALQSIVHTTDEHRALMARLNPKEGEKK